MELSRPGYCLSHLIDRERRSFVIGAMDAYQPTSSRELRILMLALSGANSGFNRTNPQLPIHPILSFSAFSYDLSNSNYNSSGPKTYIFPSRLKQR
jgi:hypothetical protein